MVTESTSSTAAGTAMPARPRTGAAKKLINPFEASLLAEQEQQKKIDAERAEALRKKK